MHWAPISHLDGLTLSEFAISILSVKIYVKFVHALPMSWYELDSHQCNAVAFLKSFNNFLIIRVNVAPEFINPKGIFTKLLTSFRSHPTMKFSALCPALDIGICQSPLSHVKLGKIFVFIARFANMSCPTLPSVRYQILVLC